MRSLRLLCLACDECPSSHTSCLETKRVSEALHQGASGRYMIKPLYCKPTQLYVSSNSVISWRRNSKTLALAICLNQSRPQTISEFLILGHSCSVLTSLLTVVSQLGTLTVPSAGRPVGKEFDGRKIKLTQNRQMPSHLLHVSG